MVTALIVLGVIAALLLLLLLAPVRLEAAAKDGQHAAQIRYLFLRFDLSPQARERRAGKKKAKPPKKPKDKPPEEDEEEKPKPSRTWREVRELLRSSRRGVGILRRHLVLSRVEVYVCVGGEDAHQTALRYGQISALVIGLLDVLGLLFVLKKPTVGILPDFTRADTRYELSLRASLRPMFALGAALSFLSALARRPAPKPQPKAKKSPQPIK